MLRCRFTPGNSFAPGSHNARNRSSVAKRLALRPEFSPQARMPPTARSAPRGGRHGLLLLTAGPVPDSYRRYPTGLVASPYLNRTRERLQPSSSRAPHLEGWEGSRQRFARAVHARRHLNAPQMSTRTKQTRTPPNLRYAPNTIPRLRQRPTDTAVNEQRSTYAQS